MKGQAMFKRPEDPIRIALEAEIMSTFALLNDVTEPDVHGKLVTDVCKLMELRNKERISKDAIVAALTHIAGLAVVLQHERVHVIASKAFGLIKKIV
jgi:hypothetical protein